MEVESMWFNKNQTNVHKILIYYAS